jgi:hypothetical protein
MLAPPRAKKGTGWGMFESEIAYMITDNSLDMMMDLAGITSLLRYRMRPRGTVRIDDSYFDTKQGLLRKQKINLRIRKTGNDLLLSIKSDPQRLPGRGIRRREVELPWSYQSLMRIADQLKIEPPALTRVGFSRLSPSKVLGKMGLDPIQVRLTSRTVRDIVRQDKPRSSAIAELDIDDVTYFGETRIRVSEVEIEAKGTRSSRVVQEIGEALASLYPGSMKEWSYGKLVTGLAIRRLLNTGNLGNYVVDGRLRPEAFPLIENTIQSGGF